MTGSKRCGHFAWVRCRHGRRAVAWAAALAVVVATAWPATAQEPVRVASPFLAPDHWAVAAVRRLHVLGLLDEEFPWGERSLTREEVADALHQAVTRSTQGTGRSWAALAAGYQERFAEEHPLSVARSAGQGWDGGAVEAGVDVHQGGLLAGVGYGKDGIPWDPPRPLDDRFGPSVAVRAAGRPSGWLALSLDGGWDGQDAVLNQAQIVTRWRSVTFWAGRVTPGYGYGTHGGLVLRGIGRFDGGGFFLADPVRLPWYLKHVGPIHFETGLSRPGANGPIADPWFWWARGSVSPHPRVSLGVSRAAFFGGEGNAPITPWSVLLLIVGQYGGGGSTFEDQVVAVDLAYRVPGPVPLLAFIEWGFEDAAGAWIQVPGIHAGVEAAAVPGVPELAVGAEGTYFGRSCCGNPIWYRHMFFLGGWTDTGVPLGHPLGGHGVEGALYGRWDGFRARLRTRANVFVRDREVENVYAVDREGRSAGAELALNWRLRQHVEIGASMMLECGDDWTELRMDVRAHWLF